MPIPLAQGRPLRWVWSFRTWVSVELTTPNQLLLPNLAPQLAVGGQRASPALNVEMDVVIQGKADTARGASACLSALGEAILADYVIPGQSG